MDPILKIEKDRVTNSLIISFLIILIPILTFIINDVFLLQWNDWGIHPREFNHVWSVLLIPFLHADYEHLFSNMIPLFVLSFGLLYFFKKRAYLIILFNLLVSGILIWSFGRTGNHIGASGLIYAFIFFMVTISLIKREKSLMAFSLIVIFLYGSVVWGFFPQLFPGKNISWEGHVAGAVSGIVLAWVFRDEGPQRKIFFEDEIDDEEEEEGENNKENMFDENI